MHRLRLLGLAITLAGLLAYAVGVLEPYAGRALSLTLVMVGLTVAAVGGGPP